LYIDCIFCCIIISFTVHTMLSYIASWFLMMVKKNFQRKTNWKKNNSSMKFLLVLTIIIKLKSINNYIGQYVNGNFSVSLKVFNSLLFVFWLMLTWNLCAFLYFKINLQLPLIILYYAGVYFIIVSRNDNKPAT